MALSLCPHCWIYHWLLVILILSWNSFVAIESLHQCVWSVQAHLVVSLPMPHWRPRLVQYHQYLFRNPRVSPLFQVPCWHPFTITITSTSATLAVILAWVFDHVFNMCWRIHKLPPLVDFLVVLQFAQLMSPFTVMVVAGPWYTMCWTTLGFPDIFRTSVLNLIQYSSLGFATMRHTSVVATCIYVLSGLRKFARAAALLYFFFSSLHCCPASSSLLLSSTGGDWRIALFQQHHHINQHLRMPPIWLVGYVAALISNNPIQHINFIILFSVRTQLLWLMSYLILNCCWNRFEYSLCPLEK